MNDFEMSNEELRQIEQDAERIRQREESVWRKSRGQDGLAEQAGGPAGLNPEGCNSFDRRLAGIVERFEREWAPDCPVSALNAYLPPPPERLPTLTELAIVDLEFRLGANQAVRAEEYFQEYPELADDASAAVELIAKEYEERLERQEPLPTQEDYLKRFPRYAQLLADTLAEVSAKVVREPHQVVEPEGDVPTEPSLTTSAEFRNFKRIEAGGLGVVFEAHDETHDRKVALKRIRQDRLKQPGLRERFLREGRITGSLEHPGVVPIYGLGQSRDGSPFYVMRFVEGATLEQEIARFHGKSAPNQAIEQRPLTLPELLRRFVTVCETIQYAHDHGVIHRDVKPDNIMLGVYGETLIIDWGLAKQLPAENEAAPQEEAGGESAGLILETTAPSDSPAGAFATEAGTLLGNLHFVSPEQAAGRTDQVGHATDIYALGAVLYKLLTGTNPRSETRGHWSLLQEQASAGQFRRPREVRKDVPRALEAVCQKAMAFHARDRFLTAKELAEDVKQWLDGEPVAAYHEGILERLGRWMRRHRTWVQAAMVTLLITSLLAVASAYLINKEKEAKGRLAEEERQQRTRADRSSAFAGETAVRLFEVIQRMPREQMTPGDLEWLLALDRKLENEVAEYLREIAHRTMADEPDLYYAYANAISQQGILKVQVAALDDGIETIDRAAKVLDELVRTHPKRSEFTFSLVRLYLVMSEACTLVADVRRAEVSLTRSIELLESLATDDPAEAEDVLAALSGVYNNLAALLVTQGRAAGAEAAAKRGIALRERLMDKQDMAARRFSVLSIAGARNNLAQVYLQTQKPDAAVKLLEACRDSIEGTAGFLPEGPGHEQYVATLMHTYQVLGSAYLLLRNFPQTETTIGKAISLAEELDTKVTRFRIRLAQCRGILAAAYQATGRSAQAKEEFSRCLGIYDRLNPAHRDTIEVASDMGRVSATLGWLELEDGKSERAVALTKQSVEAFEGLRARAPDFPDVEQMVFNSRRVRAIVLTEVGLYAEALTCWDRMLERCTGPERHRYLLYRAVAQAGTGAYTEALRQLEALANATSPDSFTQAKVYAAAASAALKDPDPKLTEELRQNLSAGYVVKAMDCLSKAGRSGQMQAREELESLRSAPFFAILRDREDFQNILRAAEKQISETTRERSTEREAPAP